MPILIGQFDQTQEHPTHQPHLPHSQSILPPLSLPLWTDQQPLHHYHHNYNYQDHQNQSQPSTLQQPLPHHPQPRPRDHLQQQKQALKEKNTLETEQSESFLPSKGETSFSNVSSGAKRGYNDDEQQDSDGEDKGKIPARKKIKIEYIDDKSRRHITFSKRKAGIMKKAHELSTLTGTQILLLVVSETGLVYTFTTPKLQPLVTKPEGKNLIQACLNVPDFIPGAPAFAHPIPRTPYYAHDNDPNTDVGLPTDSFYDDRKHVHPHNHVSASNFNYASFGHLGYGSQYYQTHPVAPVPMGGAPMYLNAGYPYTQSPQLPQYSAPSNTPYFNPAAYWEQSDSSSLPASGNDRVHHHPSTTFESHNLPDSPNGMLPSPPIEGLKEFRSAMLGKCTGFGDDPTLADDPR